MAQSNSKGKLHKVINKSSKNGLKMDAIIKTRTIILRETNNNKYTITTVKVNETRWRAAPAPASF